MTKNFNHLLQCKGMSNKFSLWEEIMIHTMEKILKVGLCYNLPNVKIYKRNLRDRILKRF